jgi:hypothetical protein
MPFMLSHDYTVPLLHRIALLSRMVLLLLRTESLRVWVLLVHVQFHQHAKSSQVQVEWYVHTMQHICCHVVL